MVVASDGHASSATLHVLYVVTPAVLRLGEPAIVQLTSCPRSAVVQVKASYFDSRGQEHRSYRTRASLSGSAKLRIPTEATGTLTLSTYVDGVLVDTSLVPVD